MRDSRIRSLAGVATLRACRCGVSDDPKEIEALEKRMCRGWCIGDKSFKATYAKEFLAKKESLRLEKEGLADLNESHWELALGKCLDALGKSEAEAMLDLKSADWKLAVAAKLKESTSVSNKWLSEKLHMGVWWGVSSNLSVYGKLKAVCPLYGKVRGLSF